LILANKILYNIDVLKFKCAYNWTNDQFKSNLPGTCTTDF